MTGEDAVIAAITHMSTEIRGLRQEVRKVIELEAEARNSKEALGRAFASIDAVGARVTAVDVRVQRIETQGPMSNLVRVIVFAVVALGMGGLFTVLFGGAMKQPPSVSNDYRGPTIGPPRQQESYPRSQP